VIDQARAERCAGSVVKLFIDREIYANHTTAYFAALRAFVCAAELQSNGSRSTVAPFRCLKAGK